jgi:translation initiation factor 3 subunit H
MSWAQAAQGEKKDVPLLHVQLDGGALLRIAKHCTPPPPGGWGGPVTGQLLGLDVGSTLEITSSYPFPVRPCYLPAILPARAKVSNSHFWQSRAAEEEEETEDAPDVLPSYQVEMMRNLREVNVDNNTVGWYQSTYMGSYQTVDFLDTFLTYQARAAAGGFATSFG